MRESIGGAWIFGLVITFILLFTAFLAVTINYSRAFKIKNQIIDLIEEEEGFTSDNTSNDPGAAQRIDNYLSTSGYRNLGSCPTDGSWRVWNKSDISMPDKNTKYSYCVKKHNKHNASYPQEGYYEVIVFFNLNLPVFGEFMTFKVSGETTDIFYPSDCKIWGEC